MKPQTEPVPFVLGRPDAAERLAGRCPVAGCVALDVWTARAEFALLLAGNAESYGGLAMPAWVQLDCVALPAGVIGFARPRGQVDPALYERLCERVRAGQGSDAVRAVAEHQGLVPLAQYGCVPTAEPGHVVGFSLFSLERGLGLRAKAMALAMHRARRQTGVAQIDAASKNRALRVHAALGPLEVLRAGVVVHERAADSIGYELSLDDRARLLALARGQDTARPSRARCAELPINAGTVAALEQMRQRGRVQIVDIDERRVFVRALTEAAA